MRMKPKCSVKNPRALLYRKYIEVQENTAFEHIFAILDGTVTYRFIFDTESGDFRRLTADEETAFQGAKSVVLSIGQALKRGSNYYVATKVGTNVYFAKQTTAVTTVGEVNGIKNLGANQKYNYYYVGSFDYMIQGDIYDSETQYIKGNIVSQTSFTIKYYDDNVHLSCDDMVVIENRLFSVENPSFTMKMQPKRFKIYTATLNSIV